MKRYFHSFLSSTPGGRKFHWYLIHMLERQEFPTRPECRSETMIGREIDDDGGKAAGILGQLFIRANHIFLKIQLGYLCQKNELATGPPQSAVSDRPYVLHELRDKKLIKVEHKTNPFANRHHRTHINNASPFRHRRQSTSKCMPVTRYLQSPLSRIQTVEEEEAEEEVDGGTSGRSVGSIVFSSTP